METKYNENKKKQKETTEKFHNNVTIKTHFREVEKENEDKNYTNIKIGVITPKFMIRLRGAIINLQNKRIY